MPAVLSDLRRVRGPLSLSLSPSGQGSFCCRTPSSCVAFQASLGSFLMLAQVWWRGFSSLIDCGKLVPK